MRVSGVTAAVLAAVLFGASVPLTKPLLAHMGPWMLAALLYLGSGLGLALVRLLRRQPLQALPRGEWRWLAGAVVSGGMVAPVLLMLGLSHLPASHASLLLNTEAVLTALLAWCVFRENVDRRIVLGMVAIVAGGVALTWPTEAVDQGGSVWPVLAVLTACLAWAIDNNLTRKVSLTDATQIAMVKGLAAGATNLVLALWVGAAWPAPQWALAAGVLGLVCYGASLSLFVLGLRHLGTARTGAYFSVAPFFGAVLAIGILGEPVTGPMLLAGVLMALGVFLHLTEQHAHEHSHSPLQHSHTHDHSDGHHDHIHEAQDGQPLPMGRHTHTHSHVAGSHSHAHFPDAHHQHSH